MFAPMVAHATTSPLPQLSPEDKRLLRIYFRVGQSIQALADELISIQALHRADSPHSSLPTPHSPPPDEFDLATWATSDHIAPHIAYRKQELVDARREEALKELTTLVKHSGDALERRRAATTLLRMLSTQLHRSRAPQSTGPAHSERSGASRRSNNQTQFPITANAPRTNTPPPNTNAPDLNSSLPLPEEDYARSAHVRD